MVHQYSVGLCLLGVPEMHIAYRRESHLSKPLSVVIETAFKRPWTVATRMSDPTYGLIIGDHTTYLTKGRLRPSHRTLQTLMGPISVKRIESLSKLIVSRGATRTARHTCPRR